MRSVIATCWYCAVTMSGVIQICLSVSRLCVVMWGVVGGGLIVVCVCGSVDMVARNMLSNLYKRNK